MTTLKLESLIESLDYRVPQPMFKNKKLIGFTVPSNWENTVNAVRKIKKANSWYDSGIYTDAGYNTITDYKYKNGSHYAKETNDDYHYDLIELAWDWNEYKNEKELREEIGDEIVDDPSCGTVLPCGTLDEDTRLYIPIYDCYRGGNFNRGNETNMFRIKKALFGNKK